MPPWAFCESLQSDVAIVEDAEAHHLLHVLRLKSGEFVTLFDGNGSTALAEITSVSRRDLTCKVIDRADSGTAAGPQITVAVSPPKGDRLKWMVEKLTEIGAHRLQLMDCERTVASPGETRVDKLRATTIGACKQCRRPVLLDIQPLQPFRDVIETAIGRTDAVYVAHPGDNSNIRNLAGSNRNMTILIGPEGGFTDEEIRIARAAGLTTIAWPQTILRIETAAIVFASLALAASDM